MVELSLCCLLYTSTTISNDTLILFHFLITFYENSYVFAIAACAAASLAIGTRNGEQDT